MTRWINESGDAVVQATAADGASAVAILSRIEIDVVVLDIEMPTLDGLSALPQLLAARPGVRILMASSFSERGADVTLEALRLGASDAIAKPRAGWAARGSGGFQGELVDRIRTLGAAREVPAAAPLRAPRSGLTYARSGGIGASPQLVVIGASTGGPNALFQLVGALPSDLAVPVLIAQHMPALFTAALARQLNELSAIRVVEARGGERPEPGTAYLAPGGADMTVAGSSAEPTLVVGDAAGSSAPSVDRLLVSAVPVCGPHVLGVLLSGMGNDGLAGAGAVVSAGGAMLVQDHASAIVWGMPGAVVRAGLAFDVLPPARLAGAISRAVAGALAESR